MIFLQAIDGNVVKLIDDYFMPVAILAMGSMIYWFIKHQAGMLERQEKEREAYRTAQQGANTAIERMGDVVRELSAGIATNFKDTHDLIIREMEGVRRHIDTKLSDKE